MRMPCLILLFMSGGLAAQEKAVMFIDSSQPAQSQLVNTINQMLFYSPTLRERLAVEVFDINPREVNFSGELTYIPDRQGLGTARYRPEALPFLICLADGKETLRMSVKIKEQLCLCIQNC
ncbi:hypothetical protein BV921_04320 [Pectobacterium odoriferum]|uniref:Uncharacterized protein n=3 Tax=Pectobacterium odoriferum TaxID=78398 RepID=A0ABD6VV28_9GAMM|nr:hypothetical protein [Pectobacterium odoriferum]GKW04286.1 hypothetical protein PEC301877_30990 [Pectobacterium carotovorum subsp. carotovorum]AIU86952.1 hypothetical protein BCS7_01195 [Pectobacterium odoriferum]KGA32970.1 hypothetical protein KS43_15870 [Pectobacterium odoriferum]KGA41356.1 hypothetical protein KU75_11235 [Pectobacterium odoriferum]MBA0188846.1 hypothetical protein [Pectobacterium odoriferum]